MKKEELPKKPLPRETCAINARKALKQAKKEGKPILCDSCLADKHVICPATGHVICSNRKDTGWIPVPFGLEQCGLYAQKTQT